MRKAFAFGMYQLKTKAFSLNYQWISHHHAEEFPILSTQGIQPSAGREMTEMSQAEVLSVMLSKTVISVPTETG